MEDTNAMQQLLEKSDFTEICIIFTHQAYTCSLRKKRTFLMKLELFHEDIRLTNLTY